MKKIYLLIVLLLFIKISNGQEFVFSIYFEDAAGFRDTLVLGYDINATDSIDEIFGEVNIISQALNEDFDVRVTNEYYGRPWTSPPTYHTKKQIIKNSCDFDYEILPVLAIDIKSNHWPISAKWDSTLFSNDCVMPSQFASFPYWEANYDVIRPNDFQTRFYEQSQVTSIIEYCDDYRFNHYVNGDNDTIYVLYLGLDDKPISLNIENENFNENDYELFNDKEILTIKTNKNKVKNIEILDLTGKTLKTERSNNINISNLPAGLYFCRIINSENKIKTYKFVK